MVNRWYRDRVAIKEKYQSNPKAKRTFSTRIKKKIPKDLRYLIYKTVWNESHDREVPLNSTFIKQTILSIINTNQTRLKAFTSRDEGGYDAENENHIVITDYIVSAFRNEFTLLKFPGSTNYNPCELMEKQIPSLIILLTLRLVFDIEFSICIYIYICIYLLYNFIYVCNM